MNRLISLSLAMIAVTNLATEKSTNKIGAEISGNNSISAFQPLSANFGKNVTVINGVIEARKRGQRSTHVWANVPAVGQVFDRWTGDTHLLANPFESHTKLNLLGKNITITATFRNAPAWNHTNGQINGIGFGYFFPPNHVGVIFRFHGSGGNYSTFFNQPEDRFFANDAVAAGFAVVSLESADRINRQWDHTNPPPTNADLQNVMAIIQDLRNRGLMRANEKIFALGFSNGAVFSSYIAHLANWAAAACYSATGLENWILTTTIPHIWSFGVNESSGNPTQMQRTYEHYLNLVSRGIPARHSFFYPSPVFPKRFQRIFGMTEADSLAIYNSLKNAGKLDGFDHQIISPRVSNWRQVIPPPYNQNANLMDDIGNQLDNCWAEHQFQADFNHRTIEFFTARL